MSAIEAVEAETKTALERVAEATKEFPGCDYYSAVCRSVKFPHSAAICDSWDVTMSIGSIHQIGMGATFDKALSDAVNKMRSAPVRCKVCGGRMDNECKHSH